MENKFVFTLSQGFWEGVADMIEEDLDQEYVIEDQDNGSCRVSWTVNGEDNDSIFERKTVEKNIEKGLWVVKAVSENEAAPISQK